MAWRACQMQAVKPSPLPKSSLAVRVIWPWSGAGDKGRAWPIPFSVAPVLARKGQNVAILASGDPFWFGAGSSLTAHLNRDEWQAFPAPSTFQLAAAQLGWRIEEITCHGLHAAPFTRLRPVLTKGQRAICLLRDGDAPQALAGLADGSRLHRRSDRDGSALAVRTSASARPPPKPLR